MIILTDTGYGLNVVNLDFRQSVEDFHPNLVVKFAYLKDLSDVYPFNVSGVGGGK